MGCCSGKESSSPGSVHLGTKAPNFATAASDPGHQHDQVLEPGAFMAEQTELDTAGLEGLDDDFKARIASAAADQLILIRLFKGDCNKCEDIGRYYQSLVPQYRDAVFLDANVTRNNHAIGAMNIQAVPTFVAFKDHREIGRYTGTDPSALHDLVQTNYSGNADEVDS